MMNNWDPTYKKLVLRMIALNLILIGLWFFFSPNPGPWIKGTVLGTLLALLMFWQMKNTLEKAVKKPPAAANKQVRRGYFIRYAIYFIVFTLTILSKDINFITTIISVVSMKYIVLLSGIFDKSLIPQINTEEHEENSTEGK